MNTITESPAPRPISPMAEITQPVTAQRRSDPKPNVDNRPTPIMPSREAPSLPPLSLVDSSGVRPWTWPAKGSSTNSER